MSDNPSSPILLFDSGVGGLTVYDALREVLPQAPVIYAADLAGLPYGTKTEAQIAAVEEARGRIIESYTEETLVEAIAVELERSHGFYPALDRRLVAAVRASVEEGETALIPLGDAAGDLSESANDEVEDDPDLRDAEDLLAGREPRALRSAVVELERAEDESN